VAYRLGVRRRARSRERVGTRVTSLAVDILDLPTPSLLVERGAPDRNVATMAARWPGARLRHVKAFTSTALA
jgi:D-serine deaminase-like pyridoxal phosphate-dependent protein